MKVSTIARGGTRTASSGVRLLRRQGSQRRLAPLPQGSRLYLGCGPNHPAGWINIDIDSSVRPDVRLDLRLGVPFPRASASLIYSEHVLEHFSLADGVRIMKDCHRVLEPGGRMSITDIVSAKQLSQSIVNDPKLWAS